MTELTEPLFKKAVVELLYQLADDDFILAYRGSEWLGLAPHIEEDVAFSSINQDTMGHAAMYYGLLEQLGEGDMDTLSHARGISERKNAVLLELPNGSGHYLKEPRYDWAFTVVRHFYYSHAKKVKLESLKHSSYEPLAHAAVKISMELYYHLMHWTVWFNQLMNAGGEAKRKMLEAISRVEQDFLDVCSLGPLSAEMASLKLIDGDDALMQAFHENMKPVFDALFIPYKGEFQQHSGKGRYGEHTQELHQALATLTEVYRTDPAAAW
ncbi:1,2-phenylacetyl-CoA epoxidase subunit PaaC [Jeotgalibacillus campisalis]|uniref:Phenylacetate-CoA oxygenase subunit PaaI n=1 Tax=Jeotgalibacillus campisalis TaxID=220754 RepID=A0A0C2S068_9BACL|nr:1,2-phenylacetyl-CoA epoxidase subunit PaaC [Jeotgalibacillus campisalis]KIL47459.1 phenylacetate-CoA oxygenase subunit PaaI [Jeotgalibacillus campisalis]